jgi:hypothetical protein
MSGYEISARDIVQALLADPRFQLKEKGDYLRGGPCPSCGKKELFISIEQPWVMKCSRLNNCGWEEPVRDLLPELFENFVDKYPPTETEPDRTANVYMGMNRGFDLSKIRGWYDQGTYQYPHSNYFTPTVRVYVDTEKTVCWQRLIKPDKHAENKGKARVFGDFKGMAWTPPGMEIERGDRVFIVEGIFHGIALQHVGIKAAAAISSSNFPRQLIEAHKDKGVVWVLALDGDKAGADYTKRHAKKLRTMGEQYEVCRPANKQDWDDLFRAGRLTDKYIEDGLYRGRLFMSETANEKAYHYYVRNRHRKFVLEFGNSLFGVKVSDSLDKELMNNVTEEDEKQEDGQQPFDSLLDAVLKSPRGRDIFRSNCDVDLISNVYPDFLYMEVDPIMDEQRYVFKVCYSNGNSDDIIGLDGTHLTSPEAFNKAMLTKARGGTFDGDVRHLKYLRDRWLNHSMLTVASVPFVGYDRELQTYVYQKHAYHMGKEIALNEHGYFEIGRKGIKTSLVAVAVHTRGEFNPNWLEKYHLAFGWQGLALLAFWMGSLFAQQIRAEDKTFPFFEFTGEPGAGKSTALEFLWKCCGRDEYEGFDVMKSSPAGRRRAFNQLSNLPVVIIESDRDTGSGDKDAKAKMFNFDECKPFFNGRSTGTLGVAKRGNEIEEHLFQASLIISQNAEVEGSEALLQRIVHVHVTKKHHTRETLGVAKWFEGQSAATVGGFLREALTHETQILDVYRKAFQEVSTQFRSRGLLKMERIIKNHAQVAACGYALSVLFPSMTKERCEKLTEYLYERAKVREERLSADHPLLEQFWETYRYLNDESPKGTVGWLNHSREEDTIAVNLNQFRDLCLHNGQELPDIKQLKKLLPHSKRHKFVASSAPVNSRHLNKTLRCWVFEA